MFILGSSSPRRKELLLSIGISADLVVGPEIDETPLIREKPRPYVWRMATEKNAAIQRAPIDIVLTADTIVTCGTRILGKPKNREMARRYLELLSGRRHNVVTAVVVSSENINRQRIVETRVKMKNLSDSEIDWYLETNEWKGKAGGYAIQGKAAVLIPFISGSYTNVMGLPLAETANILRSVGYGLLQKEG